MIIGELQCGFRRNKSKIDQIFILRQMIEKHNEQVLDLQCFSLILNRPIVQIGKDCLNQWTKWEYHRS